MTKRTRCMTACAAVLGALAPSVARAASDGAAAAGVSAVRLLASLAVVVALVYVVAWALRRAGRHRVGASGRMMEVVDVLPLGPNSRLVVVRVGERTLVVGAGDHAVTPVTELDAGEIAALEAAETVVPLRRRLARLAGR